MTIRKHQQISASMIQSWIRLNPPLHFSSAGVLIFSACVCPLQANAMVERIGYPEFILSDEELDVMYTGVSIV